MDKVEDGTIKVECPACGGEGIRDDGSCMCGDDTCCCAEPEAPECSVCDGYGWVARKAGDQS